MAKKKKPPELPKLPAEVEALLSVLLAVRLRRCGLSAPEAARLAEQKGQGEAHGG